MPLPMDDTLAKFRADDLISSDFQRIPNLFQPGFAADLHFRVCAGGLLGY
jgi:hypothetical protein